jgi:hypothetical protein
MAAPERFAEKSDSSCTAGTVHTWPILLQKSLSGGLGANSRNIRLWTDVSLNQKCAWIAKFGIFFSAQTPKIFLQQYRPRATDIAPQPNVRFRRVVSTGRRNTLS